ncbi:MAG: hypothetical protein AAF211_16970, partial [Myxococcota bacterium]
MFLLMGLFGACAHSATPSPTRPDTIRPTPPPPSGPLHLHYVATPDRLELSRLPAFQRDTNRLMEEAAADLDALADYLHHRPEIRLAYIVVVHEPPGEWESASRLPESR